MTCKKNCVLCSNMKGSVRHTCNDSCNLQKHPEKGVQPDECFELVKDGAFAWAASLFMQGHNGWRFTGQWVKLGVVGEDGRLLWHRGAQIRKDFFTTHKWTFPPSTTTARIPPPPTTTTATATASASAGPTFEKPWFYDYSLDIIIKGCIEAGFTKTAGHLRKYEHANQTTSMLCSQDNTMRLLALLNVPMCRKLCEPIFQSLQLNEKKPSEDVITFDADTFYPLEVQATNMIGTTPNQEFPLSPVAPAQPTTSSAKKQRVAKTLFSEK